MLALTGLLTAYAFAQSNDNGALPDDPSAALSQSANTPSVPATTPQAAPKIDAQDGSLEGKQTKRILGIVPNFRSVSVDVKLPPESPKDKFKEATQDAFDYSDFIFCAALAGVGQAENSYPEFHQGAVGYGRYYWHALVDQADEDYETEFIVPVLLHQDPRFYTLGRGGFAKRFVYAFGRVFITRTDHGNETINAAEIVGAGAAAGVSDLYYPAPERTWTKTGQRWVLNMGLDGATYTFQEFWPTLNNKFFHQKN
ncbi:MAG: hypothetical protein WCC27_01600 [Acidobacteriaceae bacterium]